MKRTRTLPAAAATLVERVPGSVLLWSADSDRSGKADAGSAGWTQLLVNPIRQLQATNAAELAALLRNLEQVRAAGLTAAGFFCYECANWLEPRAGLPMPAPGEPLAWFGVYERGWQLDADQDLAGLLGSAGLKVTGSDMTVHPSSAPEPSVATGPEAESEAYMAAIGQIHAWIAQGDVYQMNYTLPLDVNWTGGHGELFRKLVERQPVAQAAMIHWRPGRQILSLSPELFFRVEAGERGARRIVTRPMKGTAARGRTTAEDRAQAAWLAADAKNRAENLMIVDLLRNDLGRVARVGTVQVEQLFAVERHPTLWQMTSTVAAELRPEADLEAIFRALFPCGSITGAPKLRAMQLLGRLEGRPRGVYTGSIGVVSPKRVEFNVAIRTLEFEGSRGRMGVGGGIVIDSEARSELAECQLKAGFLTRTQPAFELIESLLWHADYPRLELHLERLADSAAYFDFACDQARVREALMATAREFTDGQARKVRLSVNREGGLRVSAELLGAGPGQTPAGEPVRVLLSVVPVDERDPFYFHKTTHRPLYTQALAEARRQGCDEVLFLNRRGELTEGAISNVFVESAGRWLTPPVACGLLAGVERRHLLATRRNVEERVLRVEDLLGADVLWLANAVRGLRRAQLVSTGTGRASTSQRGTDQPSLTIAAARP